MGTWLILQPRIQFFYAALSYLALSQTCFAVSPHPLFQLEQAIESEQYANAWKQAQTLKDRYEGDAQFDYLYGLAALETQHFDYALLALRRAVINNPKLVRARLELARTYAQLNNQAEAINELKTALTLPMPDQVRLNVQTYLSALEQKQQTYSGQWQKSLSFALGHDSNVNLGVSDSSISLPIFGDILLKNSSIKQDSVLNELGLALTYSQVINEQAAWFMNGNFISKHYAHAVSNNTKELSFTAGYAKEFTQYGYQISAGLQAMQLDDQNYQRTANIEGSFKQKLTTDQALVSALSWQKLEYQQANNKNQNNQKIQLSEQFYSKLGHLNQQISLAASHDVPDLSQFKYLNRDVVSVGYGLTKTLNAQTSTSIGLNLQNRLNQAEDLTYKVKRQDKRWTLQMNYQNQFSKQASFFANAGYIYNNSNLELYDSKKAFIKTGINYQF